MLYDLVLLDIGLVPVEIVEIRPFQPIPIKDHDSFYSNGSFDRLN